MSKHLVFQFGVFYALDLLFAGVIGFVPSPTNVSVVCHNFVNVLYWNYSNPTEQLKFSVKVKPYVSDSQTADTLQTYLDISSYSRDVGDDYIVFVTAHDGQEKSESVSITFPYSQDFFEEKKKKCSLDSPAVNTSVHKNVIEVSFQHPFFLHQQDILNEEFMYTVTHDEQKVLYSCFVEEKLCTVEIHLNESTAGQCVELKFEGKIAGIPSYTYRNVCVPQQMPETDKSGLIVAVQAGGTIVLFIITGFLWLLCRKLSKIPKSPEFLRNVIPGQSLTTQPEPTAISAMTPQGHTPLLTDDTFSYGSPPISPNEKDCKENTLLDETIVRLPEESEEDVNCDDFEGFGLSSDYDSPKFLQEMSPGDITEGYGPRPPVI
ncbi:interferon gamma receptor 1-like [Cyprinus carpio]|uniref:Interferon gamma receptor 1-like n=1 Tax=Cyprinus carpio TaxID=7962 RepID=A0A9Q9YQ24_CYPCA|nr:interferon gamma receptor 1-like [Cyprinus carpio]